MFFKVSYSLSKDVLCYLNFVWKFNWIKHGKVDIQKNLMYKLPQVIQNQLTTEQDKDKAEQIIKKFLESRYKNNRSIYKIIASELEEYLNKQCEYFHLILDKIFDKKVPFKKINVYLGTAGIGPYNYEKKWILVALYKPLEEIANSILHELNHFMFHYYFPELKDNLDREKYESLKESLTALTNTEEEGYPNHQNLRKWLREQNCTIPEIIEKGEWKKYF